LPKISVIHKLVQESRGSKEQSDRIQTLLNGTNFLMK
jgi:hypothetical protein